jgi:signal transduction histidine kinase/DNA-binding NarL/FixJ family response regulator
MKTILVLAPHPEFAAAIRAAVNLEQFRIIDRLDVDQAEPLLRPGLLDVCIFDAESATIQGLWTIEKVRRRIPDCPLLIYTASKQWEWEEEAYLNGVSHVLTKPVRGRLLNSLLDRIGAAPSHPPPASAARPRSSRSASSRPSSAGQATEAGQSSFKALEVVRDFSTVLTHSLSAEALLKQLLLLLREIIGVNRAAVFLRQPLAMFGKPSAPAEIPLLRSACAIGLLPGLLEHFQLSFEAGIGGFLFSQGRILRRESEEAQDEIMQKEFDLLGAQVAIPILDRETLIGVATFDGRVTGEPLVNSELELIFHLLEDLALAVKNVWLHDQLAANHEIMADILRQLKSGCILIGSDLSILHANKIATHYFAPPGRRNAALEFADLPQTLGTKVYQVLKTGTGIATFKHNPPEAPNLVYHISIVPLQTRNPALPTSALLIVEDYTQAEQLQRLEIEATNLRLVKSMAERLAHEIGNSIVPLSTHQQLLDQKFQDPEFRNSLSSAMGDSVKRISRLAKQMFFLARDNFERTEVIPLKQLLKEAFHEAQNFHSGKAARLLFEDATPPLTLAGDQPALKYALSEILLNAIQAHPTEPRVTVNAHRRTGEHPAAWIQIEIADPGAGFSAETASRAFDPFYTTRNVGIGLGLTVARKIIESHRGKIELAPPERPSGVVISLPSE